MKALSIRQPWAWLILNAGKDIENRDWPTSFRGRFLIHASKCMTRDEYLNGLAMVEELEPRVELPPFDKLERGGIVGSAVLVDCVRKSESPWFFGDYGFEIRDVVPLPFRPYKGALGFFEVAARWRLERHDLRTSDGSGPQSRVQRERERRSELSA